MARKRASFAEQLRRIIERNDSLLCVGLDPDPARFPQSLLAEPDPTFSFNKAIIDATCDLVCAYKPNLAFYEAQGLAGLQALKRTIDYVPPEIPVILDAKRGDIGSTAVAYARAAFDVWGADAITVNPYLGHDAVRPFTDYRDRGIFILCHTSNPGAEDFQTLLSGGQPLYRIVVERALEWNEAGNIGLVVGATYPEALSAVREMAPNMWFLLPGIGAQGGDLEKALAAGLDGRGQGVIVSASRSIIYAADPRAEAASLRERINRAREAPRSLLVPTDEALAEALILALHDVGAIRFGDFTLQSRQRSPIYIDLRLLPSHPALLRQVARAYVSILRALTFDCMAAIPYAALPIGTAVALEVNRPLIYPRKEVKAHGTRRAIEGQFQRGERVVVLDDLVTTGASKLAAIAPLKEAGLVVEDIVVLIDREQGGREHLAEQGYRLHAVLHLEEMLDILARQGRISREQSAEVRAFLAEGRA